MVVTGNKIIVLIIIIASIFAIIWICSFINWHKLEELRKEAQKEKTIWNLFIASIVIDFILIFADKINLPTFILNVLGINICGGLYSLLYSVCELVKNCCYSSTVCCLFYFANDMRKERNRKKNIKTIMIDIFSFLEKDITNCIKYFANGYFCWTPNQELDGLLLEDNSNKTQRDICFNILNCYQQYKDGGVYIFPENTNHRTTIPMMCQLIIERSKRTLELHHLEFQKYLPQTLVSDYEELLTGEGSNFTLNFYHTFDDFLKDINSGKVVGTKLTFMTIELVKFYFEIKEVKKKISNCELVDK